MVCVVILGYQSEVESVCVSKLVRCVVGNHGVCRNIGLSK